MIHSSEDSARHVRSCQGRGKNPKNYQTKTDVVDGTAGQASHETRERHCTATKKRRRQATTSSVQLDAETSLEHCRT